MFSEQNKYSSQVILFFSVLFFLLAVSTTFPRVDAVVGGFNENITNAPWSAAFVVHAGDSDLSQEFLTCSATILNNRWLMTAFKCVQQGTNPAKNVFRTFPLSRMRIRLGSDTFKETETYHVLHVALNESFPELALIKLNTNITNFANFTLNSTFVTDSLPLASAPPQDGQLLYLSGWGALRTDGFTLPKTLQAFTTVYNSSFDCGLTEAENATGFYLCAGNEDPIQTACAADYGAILVTDSGEGVGIYLQSNGDQTDFSNCKGQGIYYRTDIALDWIQNITSNYTEPNSASTPFILSSIILLSFFIVLFC